MTGARVPSMRGTRVAHLLGPPVLRPLWRIRVRGAEHMPANGPVLLAGNHTAFLDGVLLVGLSPRPVHFLTKREVFTGPLRPLLLGLGQIPVDRTSTDRAAVLDVLNVLREGGVVGVFPEGTRSTREFAEVQRGLAYFALRTGAPVIPVACLGTGDRGATLGAVPRLRARIDVVFGPEIKLPEGGRGRAAVDAASERLREGLTQHLAEARRVTGRPPRD
jgi:1-acyl-sn-glycerol-3-phosphate acyltransferase